jgi:hypothetical protein
LAVIVMFLPVDTDLLGVSVSCGNGWQAVTATGTTGAVCNRAGQTRGLIALTIFVVGVVLACVVGRVVDRREREEALVAVLTPEQRATYEATLDPAKGARGFGVVTTLAIMVFLLVLFAFALILLPD